MLDVTQRLIVIVGGGTVAVRKAQGLIAAGARRIRCVALEFHPQLPREVERITGLFEPWHLEGASLVFAATDSSTVNDAVVREAHRRGALVNRADMDENQPGDFTTPAMFRKSAVTVTVSAAGSPALAARIRDDLAARMDPNHLAMAQALLTLRPLIRDASSMPIEKRRVAFRDLTTAEAMSALADGGMDGLRRWLVTRHPELGSALSQADGKQGLEQRK